MDERELSEFNSKADRVRVLLDEHSQLNDKVLAILSQRKMYVDVVEHLGKEADSLLARMKALSSAAAHINNELEAMLQASGKG